MAVEYLDCGNDDGIVVGRSSGKMAFYGLESPLVKPSSTALATLAITSTTVGGFGFTTSAQADALVAQVKAITSALVGLGLLGAS
jgi:hypothetical protein